MSSELRVLFEDAHCLAVSKPPQIPTQGPGEQTIEGRVRRHLAPEDPHAVYLGTVHRLDRPVSGVLLWAKTPRAARRIADQFADRTVRKEYWALIEGPPPGLAGRWDDWLCAEDTGLGAVQLCAPGTPRSRRAVTRWRRHPDLRPPADRAGVILEPETGRTHQLRVQLSARGLPILGDRQYGSVREWPEGIALHARSLTFEHPGTHQPLTILAEPPGAWATVVEGGR